MKQRRDITLGEMQDECKMHTHCGGCKYCSTCFQSGEKLIAPNRIDLTDPPRFNESQMAFWKQWIAWGARYAMENKDFPHIIEFMREGGMSVGKVFHYDVLTGISLNKDETLDLAELLGKD